MAKTLKIASRQSDLARIQTQTVAAAIQKKNPDLKIEFHFRASLGDQNQSDPLWKMPEKGVFTEDFYKDLVDEKVDLVVHSWKDLPTEGKPDTEIIATLARADQRDLFLFKRDRLENIKSLRVLTSSPRRAYNLEPFFKNYFPREIDKCEFLNVRGNILTRMKKLFAEDVDALIVAKAALDRLLAAESEEYLESRNEIKAMLEKCEFMCLPLSENPTAAAQGAIAIEIKKTSAFRDILREINDDSSFQSVLKEREILANYGGGCHQKIGISVLQRPYGELTFLKGFTDAGEVLDKIELKARDFPKAKSTLNIFPNGDQREIFFDRVPTPKKIEASFIWVAKDDALPNGFEQATQLLWTSGLKTWRKLAKRGYWVTGSSEALGENEEPRLEQLLGKISWTKLTHEDGQKNLGANMKLVTTYRLQPRTLSLDLKEITHFFWSSGSSFDLVFKQYPEIRDKWHFCGAGHSFDHIKKCLGSENQLRICLDYQDWLKKVTS